MEDLTTSIGPFAISGNRISKITGTLKLQKSVGESFYFGGFQVGTPKNPNINTNSLLSGSTIVRAKGTGIIGPSGTTIDVNNYDPNGTGTITSIGANQYVAHRIWLQPTENTLVFQYGQYQYSNLADARVNFPLENYIAPTVLSQETYLVAVIICRAGETNLDNTARAQIIPQGKFAGTGGGGTTPDTLQSAYNNSTSPEIVTDGTRGAVDFRAGSGLDTNNIVTFQQNSGTVNGFVTGLGNAKFNSLSGSSVTISTIPTLNNSGTQILVRNSSTGLVNYRDVSTITPDTDLYITGYTYNPTTNTFTITRNDLSAFTATISTVSGLTSTGNIDVQGNLSNSTGILTLNDNVLVTGNATINGDVTILGTATTINTETLTVEDNIITLNSTVTAGTPTLDSGVEVLRGSATTAQFLWDETNDYWTAGLSGSTKRVILKW